MKYFYDDLYSIIPAHDKYIIYCGNLRKAIKLSYSKMYIFKTIVENQDRMTIEEMLNDYKISRDDYDSFVNQMVKKRIFFTTKEALEKEDFSHINKQIINKNALQKAYLHVTQRCNLNCYYCYNKKNLNSGRKELTSSEWQKAINELYRYGVRDFVITGGEPTLRDDLDKILRCVPNDCKISILTNGTLLKDETVKMLDSVDEFIISLDSLERGNNDSNRKNSTNYDVISNIESLDDNIKKKISVRTVITKNNIEDVKELKEFVENKLHVKHISSGYLPNSEEEMGEFIPVKNEVNYKLKMSNLISCGACAVEIAIDSNGDIYPCQSLIKPEFKICNIFDDEWINRIEEKKANTFCPANINEIEKCKDCVYKYFCGNGCRAITYNIYKDICRRNDFFCEFYKEKALTDIKKLFSE